VLGLKLEDPDTRASGVAAAPFIDLLVEVRAELRAQKLWALSDIVRDRLAALGVTIEDTPTGTHWHARD
jgi:cysteinyl-tRNA synthetase